MIRFSLPHDDHLTLKVYDALGRLVSTRPLGEFSRGDWEVAWEPGAGSGLSSGVYLYQLEGRQRSPLGRLVYLK